MSKVHAMRGSILSIKRQPVILGTFPPGGFQGKYRMCLLYPTFPFSLHLGELQFEPCTLLKAGSLRLCIIFYQLARLLLTTRREKIFKLPLITSLEIQVNSSLLILDEACAKGDVQFPSGTR